MATAETLPNQTPRYKQIATNAVSERLATAAAGNQTGGANGIGRSSNIPSKGKVTESIRTYSCIVHICWGNGGRQGSCTMHAIPPMCVDLQKGLGMDYESVLIYWINLVSFQSRRELSRRFAEAGEQIAAEEWACLLTLWKNGPLSPSKIAEGTVRDRTTSTRLIDRLERKGIVRRVSDESDRRRVIVELTERGESLREILVPIAKKYIGEATGDIDPEHLRISLETVRKISRRLDMLAKKTRTSA